MYASDLSKTKHTHIKQGMCVFVSDAQEQKACRHNPKKIKCFFFFGTLRKHWGCGEKQVRWGKTWETCHLFKTTKLMRHCGKATEFHDKLNWQYRKKEIRWDEKHHCVRGWEEEEGFIPTGFSSQSSSSPTAPPREYHLLVPMWFSTTQPEMAELNTELLIGAWLHTKRPTAKYHPDEQPFPHNNS